jgi:hypothetical protein
MSWLGALFVVVAGLLVILNRRPLAKMHAAILGGSILPGCVVAEGLALLAIGAAMFLLQR